MFVATLIARRGDLSARVLDEMSARLSAREHQWLAPEEAADLYLDENPADFEVLWREAQNHQADLVIQPVALRRKRLLLADMDSTMIEQECIDELADITGHGEKVRQITAQAMNGEIAFDGALKARVALLKGLSVTVIDEVIKTRLSFTPGAHTLLKTMKANGSFCALVSGGFMDFTAYVAGTLGFDHHRANQLGREGQALSGQVEGPILGREAKVQSLDELVAQQGITAAQVLAVGDGANDLGMLTLAGLGVALHAKPEVARQCKARINFGDLSALLFVQGYRREAFL